MFIQKNNPFNCTPCGRRRSFMQEEESSPLEQSNKRTKGKGRHFRSKEEGAGMTAAGVAVSYTHLTLPTKA